MLQRHVEIFDRPWCFRDRRQERIRDMSRVRVHHANPFDVFDLAESADQCGKRVDLPKILAVAGRILRDQDDLLYTLLREIPRFFDDRSEPARPERSAHRWDRAKRAWSIAT